MIHYINGTTDTGTMVTTHPMKDNMKNETAKLVTFTTSSMVFQKKNYVFFSRFLVGTIKTVVVNVAQFFATLSTTKK